MRPQSGGGGSRATGARTRTAPEARTASGRYRKLEKADLLSSILGETADQAAAEEAALTAVLAEKQREEAAQREADERARRETAEASRREELERRRHGEVVRAEVARAIEEEELRASGLWNKVNEQRREAPNTGELAILSDAALLAAARGEEYRALDIAPQAKPRVALWAGAAAAAIVAGVVVGLVAAGGPDLDPATYPRNPVPVVEVANPLAEVAVLQRVEERRRREPRHNRDDATQVVERRADHHGRTTEAPPDVRAPLDITLDGSGIFDRGSEL